MSVSRLAATGTAALALALAAAFAPSPAAAGPPALPYVTSVTLLGATVPCDTCAPIVCTNVPITVVLHGVLPDSCTTFVGAHLLPTLDLTGAPVIGADFRRTCAATCPPDSVPFTAMVSFVRPASGPSTFGVRVAVNACPDTALVPVAAATYPYIPDTSCSVLPPPGGPDAFAYLWHVTFVGASAVCDSCIPHVCANAPLLVRLQGGVPPHCVEFLGARYLPTMNPFGPPVVGFGFRRLCDVPCGAITAFDLFDTTVAVPAPAAGWGQVELRGALNVCPDTTLVAAGTRRYAFLADSCPAPPPPSGCVMPVLLPYPKPDSTAAGCHLRLPPGGTGTQGFAIRSTGTPVGGAQGRVWASPGLAITGIHAVGPASGMHLVTQPDTLGGVRFLLYGDGSAVIPAFFDQPVLAVTVHADTSLHAGQEGLVGGIVSAASDSLGSALPLCVFMPLVVVAAHVCIEAPVDCDANGDGSTDVADLVRMARCWAQPAVCPDSTHLPDCNGDGAFGGADILCCAREILGLGHRDSTHAAPGLRASLGTPTFDGTFVRVPLTVEGITAIDGALLHVTFPGERFVMRPPGWPEPTVFGSTTPWLPLVETGEGDGVVGVLRLDESSTVDRITVSLVLELKAGQAAGGTLRIDQGDVMAPDGSALALDLSRLVTELPVSTVGGAPITRVELACGPNPAAGATRFVVRLPQAAPVDLAVYDLAGRRLETLAHGTLAAGETSFAWAGTGRAGLYFARLSVNGIVRTTRVTMQLAR